MAGLVPAIHVLISLPVRRKHVDGRDTPGHDDSGSSLATRGSCIVANIRLIARLDIKGPNLIKGVNLEGVRVIGDPQAHARRYYEAGIDELLYIDAVASLYNRNSLAEIVRYTAENVFVPVTVGGGIRSLADVETMLRSGADKVAIN